MSLEGQLSDRKSLRAVTGKTADGNELAKDCIAFANATGGRLLLGIEEGQRLRPPAQRIQPDLPDTVRRKLAERTVNVIALADVVTAVNGGQYLELHMPRSLGVASTIRIDRVPRALCPSRAVDQMRHQQSFDPRPQRRDRRQFQRGGELPGGQYFVSANLGCAMVDSRATAPLVCRTHR